METDRVREVEMIEERNVTWENWEIEWSLTKQGIEALQSTETNGCGGAQWCGSAGTHPFAVSGSCVLGRGQMAGLG